VTKYFVGLFAEALLTDVMYQPASRAQIKVSQLTWASGDKGFLMFVLGG
jgi:hypothetical protein